MRNLAVMLPAMLAACTSDSSPCSEAAAQLSACSADQRQAFAAACEASGGADPSTLLTDDSEAACQAVPSDGKTDAATNATVGLCVTAMYGLKWSVAGLSPTPLPLSESSKAILRPLYGSLVDEVHFSIGAALPPAIVIAGHKLSVQPQAQTFGNDIFMLQEVADDKTTPYRLLLATVHEMKHAQQAKAAGGFYGFAINYCRDMIAVNFDYSHIQLEEAAYEAQHQALGNLQACGHVTCP
jgi:hypothetical protein